MLDTFAVAALILTGTIFILFFLLGRAVLSSLVSHWDPLLRDLLAPMLGIGITAIVTFTFSRAGFPIGNVARYEALLLAVVIFWGLRCPPGRRLAVGFGPILCILMAALVLVSWPFLFFGFDWLSYGNNDMTNYCLLAQRFLYSGFFDLPTVDELLSGTRYFQTFWLQGVVERAGSELLLAAISGTTGLIPLECFMPLILASHAALVSAAAGLVYASTRRYSSAAITACCLSVAPLLSFGAIYQLLGQTLGLGALCCALAATRSCFATNSDSQTMGNGICVRNGICVGLTVSALLLFYPEVSPFYFGPIGLYVAHSVWHRRAAVCTPVQRRHIALKSLIFVLAASIPTIVILRSYLFCAFSFLLQQASHGVKGVSQAEDVFQQYLQPSGLGGIWGIFNIYRPFSEPYLSTAIAVGALLLIATFLAAVIRAYKGEFLAIVLLVVFAAAAFLQFQGAAFGLYKIAMYVQPFLWGTLCCVICESRYRSAVLKAFLGTLMVFCLRTQIEYVRSSTGELRDGSNNEIYRASSTRVLSNLQELARNTRRQAIISDTCNFVLAKIQAALFSDVRIGFPFFDIYPVKNRLLSIPQAPELVQSQDALNQALVDRIQTADFSFILPDGMRIPSGLRIETRMRPGANPGEPYSLLRSPQTQSPFNRFMRPWEGSSFELIPWGDVRNHLVFVDSTLARIYYSHERAKIALYQLEPDYFYPGHTMAAMGRRLVLEALQPTPGSRLLLSITASLKSDGANRLPKTSAIGEARLDFPLMGRGSARVYSPVLTPQTILGRYYLALDMSEDGTMWKQERHGLMKLYGADVLDDPRRVTVFLRDLSLVSPEAYEATMAPREIMNPVESLKDPQLEYSGVYEDGWLSEESFFALSPPEAASSIQIAGTVPDIGTPEFSTEITISIDGKSITRHTSPPGNFVMTGQLPAGNGVRRVGITFSKLQSLPAGDRRQVGAMLGKIQFVP